MPKVAGTVGRMWADTVSAKFTDSLVQMMMLTQEAAGRQVHYLQAPVSWHEMGRNHLVENFLGDWLFMLDTDHVFAPDMLLRLLRIQKETSAPVLCGIYQYKHPPHAPVMNNWGEGDKEVLPITEWDRSARVIEVGPMPGGCMLIQRDVFSKLQTACPGEAPFSIVPGLSEDYSFCYRLRKAGIPVFVAPAVECHHLVTSALSVLDYSGTME
jgi:GT2 family glycosyltransferase